MSKVIREGRTRRRRRRSAATISGQKAWATRFRVLMVAVLTLALSPFGSVLAYAGEGDAGAGAAGETGGTAAVAQGGGMEAIADGNTASTWRDWGLENSTENVGRIWTDKTVQAGDIVLSGAGGENVIEKGDSDFLTAFSAISSTSNLREMATTPLDIVLVMDASGSMDDAMGRTDSTKRIDALKEAANSFIDEIAERNAGIANADQRHRVSIVKFAGDESNRVGNDMYRDGQNTYNYSQVMKSMATATADSLESFKSTVNSIKPAGATRSDNGLKRAQSQLDSARSEARKVVVFFTDGKPTRFSEFDPSVAASAIEAAKSMKDAGTTIYTVGIFDGADATADVTSAWTSSENKFMQAVSSNYPEATYTSSWNNYSWNFGARAENAAFYKTATNADDLKTIFNDISKEISDAAGYPTDTTDGMESKSGYVTFTDQLGDYMKVDDFNHIVFDNQVFDAHTKTTSGDIDTYTFSGVAGNTLYPSGNLSDIVIEVRRAAEDDLRTGDHVTVKIPAALIPLRAFDVDADAKKGSVTLTFPIRVFFGSSLKDGVEELLANPDVQMTDYLADHTDEDGKVFFLANAWAGGSDGDATASFTPAEENSYYYITRDTPIYEDEALTPPASYPLVAGKTYYYQRQYWDIADDPAAQKSTIVSFDSSAVENINGYVTKTDDGHAQFAKGTRRMTYINEMHDNKDANNTETASSFINPKWGDKDNSNQVFVHLGNNGKLTLTRPGSLEVEKHVEVPEGFDAADFENDEFEFTVTVSDAAGKTVKATVTKDGVVQGDANFDVTFDKNGAYSHKLKDGEKLTITGLEAGWTYKVSESAKSGWTTTPEGAEGTIAAGAAAVAKFTNTYAATGTLVGETSLAGEKTITGRDWVAGDKFAFVLTAVGDAPMPADAVGGKLVKIMMQPEDASGATAMPFDFGDIIYTQPGAYVYNIVEARAGDGYDVSILPGMSVSQALYRVTVTVTDEDRDGTLKVESSMLRLKDDSGAGLANGVGESTQVAAFTNVFDVKEAEWDLRGTKHYTDNSGTNPLTRDMFKFELAAKTSGAPMPANAADGKATTSVDATGLFAFEQVTFDENDVSKTYEYELREVNEGKPGYTYDGTVWNIAVKVAAIPSEVEGEPATVVLEVTNTRNGQAAVPGETINFENSYNVNSATVENFIHGTKTLTGRDSLDGEKFTFSLTQTSGPADGCTGFSSTAEVSALRDGVAQDFNFGTATFAKAGTYTFEVREVAPAQSAGGMTYDGHTCTVTIVVKDEGGTLVAEPAAYSSGASANFTNFYSASGTAYKGITVSKTLTGRTMQEGEFKFTIAGEDEDSEALLSDSDREFPNDGQRASGEKNEMTKLNGIVFKKSDAGKTFKFTVSEVLPADDAKLPGVTYDTREHEVVITVEDSLDGSLSVTTTVDGQPSSEVAFSNTYSSDDTEYDTAGAGFAKILEGRDWDASDKFEFEITPIGKAPAPEKSTVTVEKSDGKEGEQVAFNFGKITFTSNDVGAGGVETFVYEVREIADNAEGVTYSKNVAHLEIVVRDNGKGKLIVESSKVVDSPEFINRYQEYADNEVPIIVSKSISGTSADKYEGQFNFVLKALDDDGPLPAGASSGDGKSVVAMNADGFVNFGKLVFDANVFDKLITNDIEQGTDSNQSTGNDDSNVDQGSTGALGDLAQSGDSRNDAGTSDATNGAAGDAVGDTSDGAASAAPGNGSSDDGQSANDSAAAAQSNLATGAAILNAADNATTSGTLPASDAGQSTAAGDSSSAGQGQASGITDNGNASAGDGNTRTFEYVVYEQPGDIANITYDQSKLHFVVTVTRDAQGQITAEITSMRIESADGGIKNVANVPVRGSSLFTFVNAYEPPYTPPVNPDPDPVFASPVAKKVLEGRALIAGEFSFELVENGKAVSMGINDANGNIVFSDIKYTAAGTHTYTMREVRAGTTEAGVAYDETTYTVIAKVTNSNGKLQVSYTIEGLDGTSLPVFKNVYKPVGATVIIGATKTLTGKSLEAGQFTFRLVSSDGKVVEAANDAQGNIVFPDLTFDKAGTYEFTMIEVADNQENVTYDETAYRVVVMVVDDGKGQLVAEVSYPDGTPAFVNAYAEPEPAPTPGSDPEPGTTPTGDKPTAPGSSGPAKYVAKLAKTGDGVLLVAVPVAVGMAAAFAAGAIAFRRLRKRG